MTLTNGIRHLIYKNKIIITMILTNGIRNLIYKNKIIITMTLTNGIRHLIYKNSIIICTNKELHRDLRPLSLHHTYGVNKIRTKSSIGYFQPFILNYA